MGSCLLWQGYTRNGYGVISDGGKQVYLHRWVIAQIVGWDAIKGKVVRHTCDTPLCCNPEHLLVGTKAENMRDMFDRGRNRNGRERDHCVHGHSYDEANTYHRGDRPGHRECRTCRREAGAKWKEMQS